MATHHLTLPVDVEAIRALRLGDLVTVDGVLGRRGGPAPGPDGHNVEHVCVGVRPYDEAALTAHLARHGVAVVESGPRYGAEGEGPSLYVRDPEGNVIELKGPPD